VNYGGAEAESVLTAWASTMREAPEELNSTIVLFSGIRLQVPPRVSVLLCYPGDDRAEADPAI